MKIEEFIEILGAECISSSYEKDMDFEFAFASDMMSDVLAYADNATVLITGLNNPQTIRTAEMLDISLIILVRGKKPSKESLAIAEESNITILTTDYILFEACGKLYNSGVLPISI